MREIKFRAWSKKGMMMYDVALLRYFKKLERVGLFHNDFRYNGFTQVELESVALMQFTGLKDKNGKEIYEGDIFDCIYKRDGCNHKLLVVWDEESACFRIKGYGNCDQPNVTQTMLDIQRKEVIGNIYENPEFALDKQGEPK